MKEENNLRHRSCGTLTDHTYSAHSSPNRLINSLNYQKRREHYFENKKYTYFERN